MDKESLLKGLRIERQDEEAPPQFPGGRRLATFIAAGAGAFLLLGAILWFVLARPDEARVTVADARAVAAGGGSLLDASGFIVARRQATVSSKITGRVSEASIEEGQHVEAGEVLARLDDSNIKASLAQAMAQEYAATAGVRSAQAALADTRAKYGRDQRLHQAGYLSDQSVEDSKSAYDVARRPRRGARQSGCGTRRS